MKKTVFYLFLGLFAIYLISACNHSSNDSSSDIKDTVANAALPSDLMDSIVAINEYPENQDSVKLVVEKLKASFKYKYDDIREIGWYTHNSQNGSKTWYRSCLLIHVRNDGYMYMEDQYYADEWLFHESITVKIGDSLYFSETVPTYDSSNKTQNDGGKIWENISYTDADNYILKAIAEAGDQEVKIRFNGREYISDKILSSTDKKAIKEGYALSEALKKFKSGNL
ncbi:MAG: hypothetical protein ACU4F9_01780 [Arcticibacter sp.]